MQKCWRKKKEAIKAFIKDNNIKVISQTEFYRNDSITDTLKNEYVQLASGVYMQIRDKGSKNPADTVKSERPDLGTFHGIRPYSRRYDNV